MIRLPRPGPESPVWRENQQPIWDGRVQVAQDARIPEGYLWVQTAPLLLGDGGRMGPTVPPPAPGGCLWARLSRLWLRSAGGGAVLRHRRDAEPVVPDDVVQGLTKGRLENAG